MIILSGPEPVHFSELIPSRFAGLFHGHGSKLGESSTRHFQKGERGRLFGHSFLSAGNAQLNTI